MSDDVPEETPHQIRKRKRQEKAAIEKIKNSKAYARKKAAANGEPVDDDGSLAFDMYAKAKVVPGQMDNCEECHKRFTVTPYTKEGPDGGLLCAKCGKIQEDAKKKEAKVKKAPVVRGKRGKVQSNIMDGHTSHGAKSLLDVCIEVSLTISSKLVLIVMYRESLKALIILKILVISLHPSMID